VYPQLPKQYLQFLLQPALRNYLPLARRSNVERRNSYIPIPGPRIVLRRRDEEVEQELLGLGLDQDLWAGHNLVEVDYLDLVLDCIFVRLVID